MSLIDAPAENKRQSVLRAALVLIDERGFHGTSMSAIADEAGVGTGTIYRYFDGKEDLINQLYTEARLESHRELLKDFDADAPVRERLYGVWCGFIQNYLKCPTLYRFLLQYESSPYLRDSTRALIEDMKEPFHDMRDDGVDQGLLRDVPMPLFAAFFVGALNHLVQQHLDDEITLDDAVIDDAFEMLWASYTV